MSFFGNKPKEPSAIINYSFERFERPELRLQAESLLDALNDFQKNLIASIKSCPIASIKNKDRVAAILNEVQEQIQVVDYHLCIMNSVTDQEIVIIDKNLAIIKTKLESYFQSSAIKDLMASPE